MSCPIWRRRASICSAIAKPPEMTGRSLVTSVCVKPRKPTIRVIPAIRATGAILRRPCHSRNLISGFCAKRNGVTSAPSRSSSARTRRRSSTTSCGSSATASLAEDLTQEVFLRVYQGLPKFSLRCRFTTWLFQVTKNRVLDELRASERRPRRLVALDDVPPLEVLDAPIERVETIDALWRAIDDAQRRPEDGAAAPRRRRPLLHRDRRLARDHARHGQVADLQGARGRRSSRSPARASRFGRRRAAAGGAARAGRASRCPKS